MTPSSKAIQLPPADLEDRCRKAEEDTVTTMSYLAVIQSEARYIISLGPKATQDKFRGLYTAILSHWFPVSRGYIVSRQVFVPGEYPEYFVIRPAGGFRNPIFVFKLKRPSEWTAAGQQMVMDELVDLMEGRFEFTQYNTIYGLGCIGLHWMVCRMQRSGGHQPSLVLDWQDDIASDASYSKFGAIAELVYTD
ncbi:hypothetical protein DFH94DRAFT_750273 [Russula ochroleuca]|jgi:hypothetical protein|uniref:Uncharacterized protein n=1 Tax=Russula ochroleuca TaxID=152965 RepID=A0A9P5T812_9AGAM|nr:hypothetical protein DFH94DRAFT_750273 [Russula ochroleuca]